MARIDVAGDWAKVRAPIWTRDLIKQMPGTWWDSDQRVWMIPARLVDEMQAELEGAGYLVRVVRPGGVRPALRLLGSAMVERETS